MVIILNKSMFITSLISTFVLNLTTSSMCWGSYQFRRLLQCEYGIALFRDTLTTVRHCSKLPEGFKLIELSQEGLAPWADAKQQKLTLHRSIDISKFSADPESGRLIRFLSKEECEEEARQDAVFNIIHQMFSEKLLSEQERDFLLIDWTNYPNIQLKSFVHT